MVGLFHKVALYPTLLHNFLMSKVTSRNWYDRIDETVLLGAMPFKWMTQKLVTEENVRGVVSLTEDFETEYFCNSEEEWLAQGVRLLKIPTLDYFGTPEQKDINSAVSFILENRQKQSSVYVHCKAGRTRSTTVVACYLVKVHGWKPEEAVEFIKSKRPHIWLRDAQLKSIHQYYSSCQGNSPGG
ncbi:hypothetical protein ACJMK2_025337 [Sinanodonta woodiana]|uniref:Phosphatidylglycerophosphatase and protein-tyrosine phosphatase 1 n=1 Tax=Sinanodonta woodiana TaxID=1069815 RepID=A0ABD3XG56_SINWO